ncbi:Rof/RNase P-like protein [Mucor mucedo]|uniref:Uncharacterized protein n=1 Tax=Mucor saturninus TaxID=64648 RepID=A0A8H7QVP2_9FUNG|nr:Rof/RNase P-like protein [Mucor mucedo]KAG2199649.1 hypothetical protein INT47_005174 [Mucor saturninus]KAI7882813.1 Rof/RNase P-like protein [Mucor mucedo]
MEKAASVYQPLPGSSSNKIGTAGVKEFVGGFIKPTSNVDTVIDKMKPVHVDRSNTFIKETDKKALKKKLRNKKEGRLTAREKRRLKVYDIPKEAHQYHLFQPLGELWQGYMEKLLLQGTANFEQKLIKADFHGAPFTVIQSTNPSYVGTSGLVVQETLSMFKIITKDNKLKQIPKNSSIFNVHVNQIKKDFTVYGQQLVARPSERAAKKFKPKPSIDL